MDCVGGQLGRRLYVFDYEWCHEGPSSRLERAVLRRADPVQIEGEKASFPPEGTHVQLVP